MLRPFILIGFLTGTTGTGALAQPVSLAGDELKQAVSGAVVAIDTPLGTTVPMRFGKDGLVSAEAGVLAPVLGSAKDRGRWWVDGEQLCTKWFRWFDANVRCLTIRQDGARIYWRKTDDGEQGTGTLVDWKPPAPERKPEVLAKAEPPPAPRKKLPPREERVAAAPPAAASEPKVAPQPEPPRAQPTTVALVDPEPAPKAGREDASMMRFGGTGLLEASARIGGQEGEGAPEAGSGPQAKTDRATPATAAQAASKAAEAKAAGAAGKPSRKMAALEAVELPKRAPRKAATPAKARERDAAAPARPIYYRVTGVRRYDVLNVRRGPSEYHEPIAAIPPTGRQVEITGDCRADWCPIRYGRIAGWVNRFYLAEERPGQASSSRVYVARP